MRSAARPARQVAGSCIGWPDPNKPWAILPPLAITSRLPWPSLSCNGLNIASQDFRTTYLATAQHAYEFYVDLLMQLHRQYPDKGYNAQALEAHERAKARGLLDLLSEAKVDLRQGVNPELLRRETRLRQLLEQKQSTEIRLLAGGDGGEPGA